MDSRAFSKRVIPKLNFVFFCQSYNFFIVSNVFVHNFVKPFSGQGFFRPNKKKCLWFFLKILLSKLFYRCHFAAPPVPLFSICVKIRFKNIFWIKKLLNFFFGSGICSGMPAKTEKCNFFRNILNSSLIDGACKLLMSSYEFNI